MSGLIPLNAVVIGAVSIVVAWLMLYWHIKTGGSWRLWPAGRSLMQLFAVIFIITGNAAINVLVPQYELKVHLYFALYILLFVALIRIGFTIRSEMRKGQAAAAAAAARRKPKTGQVTVVVASENKETVDDDSTN